MVDFPDESSIHIVTNRRIRFEHKDATTAVDFPLDWFVKSNRTRPSTAVLKCKVTEEELYRSVRGRIKSACLAMPTVKCFLYAYGKTLKERLNEKWESFGCTIGESGTEVTPWDIVTILENGDHIPAEPIVSLDQTEERVGSVNAGGWTPRSMALYILCVYRLVKINNEDYVSMLEKRMSDTLTSEGGKGMSFHGVRQIYTSWLSDRGFLKMVAAYDMFMNRFPDNPSSILRMGSLSSRFRDCAGLLSVGYAMTILNHHGIQSIIRPSSWSDYGLDLHQNYGR